MTKPFRRHTLATRLAYLRLVARRFSRGQDARALRWQAMLSVIDISILAFFILGPYLRSSPSYLVVFFTITSFGV